MCDIQGFTLQRGKKDFSGLFVNQQQQQKMESQQEQVTLEYPSITMTNTSTISNKTTTTTLTTPLSSTEENPFIESILHQEQHQPPHVITTSITNSTIESSSHHQGGHCSVATMSTTTTTTLNIPSSSSSTTTTCHSSPLPFTSHRNDIAGDEFDSRRNKLFEPFMKDTHGSTIQDDIMNDYKNLYLKEFEKNKILQVQLNIMQMERQDEIRIINEIENDGRNLQSCIKKLKQIHKSDSTASVLEHLKRDEFLLFENEMNRILQPLNDLNRRIHLLELHSQSIYSETTNCPKCLELQHKSATIIQKAFRSYRLKKRMRLLLPQYDMITQRNSLISEIVHTEETYVKSLELIQRLYIDPLKNAESDSKRFNLCMLDIQTIFNNLSTILSMHKIFLMNLKQRLEQWPKVYIGESFLNQSFFFLFYVEYVNGYSQSSTTLRELRQKNREFHNFLNETKKNKECKGLSIESYLILPIQRYVKTTHLLFQ